MTDGKTTKITGPILVPVAWLLAILGSGLMGAFCIGVWVATIALNVQGAQDDIVRLNTSTEQSKTEIKQMGKSMVRVETILAFAFPKEAEKAKSLPDQHPTEE